jgi:hypothetical protein
MRAIVGEDDSLWKPMRGFFTPGTPLYNEEGGEILKGPRKVDAAPRHVKNGGVEVIEPVFRARSHPTQAEIAYAQPPRPRRER